MRTVLLGVGLALAFAGSAAAQSWYALHMSDERTILSDRDSIRWRGGNALMTTLTVTSRPEDVAGDWVQYNEFDHEFDCNGRFRALEARLYTIEDRRVGTVDDPLDWDTITPGSSAQAMEGLACRNETNGLEGLDAPRQGVAGAALRVMNSDD